MNNRVVITGIGVVSPVGTGIYEFTNALKNNKSGIKYIDELKNFGFGCCIGGIPDISNSEFLKYIDFYKLNNASQIIIFAIIAALEAWTNAKLNIPDIYENNIDYDTGAIIGSGIGSADIFGDKIIPYTNEKK